MGLALTVGILVDLVEGDPEGFDEFRSQFAAVNRALSAAKLPPHDEPTEVGNGPPWSCEMYGYSGLHYLRRVAAHLADGRPMPPPGDKEAAKDKVLLRHYESSASPRSGWLSRLFSTSKPAPNRFQHLIQHSDAEGYYLPLRFETVLDPDPSFNIAGGAIGSSPMLLEECRELAGHLELPLSLNPEADEVWEAAESQGEGDVKWMRYGVESFTCLRLLKACEFSMKYGAAIVFT